ncbi:MAG: hypothetical protein WC889_15130, partial [Myxococcota bacterium]
MKRFELSTVTAMAAIICVALCAGCTSEGGQDAGGADSGLDAGATDAQWNAGNIPSSQIPPVREWKIARTIIHAHNTYSHDACDNKPWVDPADPMKDCSEWWNDPKCVPDEQCVQDLRDGLCKDAIDAFFLTDHAGTLGYQNDFDKLYLQREGDTWITENGKHTGSRIACANGNSPILMVGAETGFMPVGFVAHPAGDVAARNAFYGRTDSEAVDYFNNQLEGVALQMHSEEQPVE